MVSRVARSKLAPGGTWFHNFGQKLFFTCQCLLFHQLHFPMCSTASFFFCFCVVCWMLRRETAGGLVKQTTGKIKKKFFTDRSFSRCSGQKYFLFLQIFLWMFCTVNFFSPLTDCSLDVLDKGTVFSSYRSFSGSSGQRFFFFAYRSFSNGCSGEWKFCSCNRSFSGCSGEKTITESNSSTFVMSLKISFFNMDVGEDSKWFFLPWQVVWLHSSHSAKRLYCKVLWPLSPANHLHVVKSPSQQIQIIHTHDASTYQQKIKKRMLLEVSNAKFCMSPRSKVLHYHAQGYFFYLLMILHDKKNSLLQLIQLLWRNSIWALQWHILSHWWNPWEYLKETWHWWT